MIRRLCGLATVLACVGLLGCGASGPFDYVPVTGTITYEDGAPIPASGLVLQFIAQDVAPVDGMHPRPATVGVNAQGEFKDVTSYKYADGLVPGRHKVALMYATDSSGKLLVPVEYTHAGTTPLEVSTETLPLVIKVPKPSR